MNFLNMFSDEAPIFNNGYRSSLYTDPSIKQGVKFLNYEKDIKNNLSENLRLISQTDGSDLGSGKVINGKIYEGMETGAGAPVPPLPSPPPPPPPLPSETGTPNTPSVSTTKPTPNPKSEFENQVMEEIKDKDIEYLKMSYSFVSSMYDQVLKSFQKDYEGGIKNNVTNAEGVLIPGERQQLVKALQIIQGSLSTINVQISDVVKQKSKVNIKAYYKIMDEIRDVKYKLINTNNKIIELTKIVDPTSAVAKREETHILSKQRYYMYIFWFILTAVVIYVMIVNMIDPNSSFSILVICIIILVCIFGFIMYDKITSSWYYDIINGIKRISIPRIGNIINFDPLVSIKYTS